MFSGPPFELETSKKKTKGSITNLGVSFSFSINLVREGPHVPTLLSSLIMTVTLPKNPFILQINSVLYIYPVLFVVSQQCSFFQLHYFVDRISEHFSFLRVGVSHTVNVSSNLFFLCSHRQSIFLKFLMQLILGLT